MALSPLQFALPSFPLGVKRIALKKATPAGVCAGGGCFLALLASRDPLRRTGVNDANDDDYDAKENAAQRKEHSRVIVMHHNGIKPQ
jgi:hypothetical protein